MCCRSMKRKSADGLGSYSGLDKNLTVFKKVELRASHPTNQGLWYCTGQKLKFQCDADTRWSLRMPRTTNV